MLGYLRVALQYGVLNKPSWVYVSPDGVEELARRVNNGKAADVVDARAAFALTELMTPLIEVGTPALDGEPSLLHPSRFELWVDTPDTSYTVSLSHRVLLGADVPGALGRGQPWDPALSVFACSALVYDPAGGAWVPVSPAYFAPADVSVDTRSGSVVTFRGTRSDTLHSVRLQVSRHHVKLEMTSPDVRLACSVRFPHRAVQLPRQRVQTDELERWVFVNGAVLSSEARVNGREYADSTGTAWASYVQTGTSYPGPFRRMANAAFPGSGLRTTAELRVDVPADGRGAPAFQAVVASTRGEADDTTLHGHVDVLPADGRVQRVPAVIDVVSRFPDSAFPNQFRVTAGGHAYDVRVPGGAPPAMRLATGDTVLSGPALVTSAATSAPRTGHVEATMFDPEQDVLDTRYVTDAAGIPNSAPFLPQAPPRSIPALLILTVIPALVLGILIALVAIAARHTAAKP